MKLKQISFFITATLISGSLFLNSCKSEEKTETEENKPDKTETREEIKTESKSEALLKIIALLPENQWTHPYELPELPYEYSALEPFIDAQTMETHHSKHHAGYTKKTNAAVESQSIEATPLAQSFAEIEKYPDAMRNNGGGYYNHRLFWTFLTPGGSEFSGEIAEAVKETFGNLKAFKKDFENAAATQFGSGWAWLVMKADGELVITQTPNQDNPLMATAEINGIPLLNIDVWEHAYYLKYKNKRGAYISNFWEAVNWESVNERYLAAKEVINQLQQ
mgnify:CR=1 FL=1